MSLHKDVLMTLEREKFKLSPIGCRSIILCSELIDAISPFLSYFGFGKLEHIGLFSCLDSQFVFVLNKTLHNGLRSKASLELLATTSEVSKVPIVIKLNVSVNEEDKLGLLFNILRLYFFPV